MRGKTPFMHDAYLKHFKQTLSFFQDYTKLKQLTITWSFDSVIVCFIFSEEWQGFLV